MKQTAIVIIAVISILLNVVLLLDEYCKIDVIKTNCGDVIVDSIPPSPPPPLSGDCYNTDSLRYNMPGTEEGGLQIEAVEATKMIDESFGRDMPKGTIKGGYISKKALDAIFCGDLTANGIFCNIGCVGGKYTFIVCPARQPQYNIKVGGTTPEARIFVSQTLCPMVCPDLTPGNHPSVAGPTPAHQ